MARYRLSSSFYAVKLCFAINVLNNKTINYCPAQTCGISPDFSQLGLKPHWLSIVLRAIFHVILQDNNIYYCQLQ